MTAAYCAFVQAPQTLQAQLQVLLTGLGCVCCHHCMMCLHSGSTNTAGAAAGMTHWAGLCVQAECEFVAEGISKVHVQKADKEEDCWRYMLRWRRLPHVNMQVTAVFNSLRC